MSQIKISNLTFAYDASSDVIFEDVSFQIDTDWKLGFTGRNGRGKTTFLNLLLGKYEYSGSILAPVAFEYFPYEVHDDGQSTIDVVHGIDQNFEHWELLRELSLLEVDEDVLRRPFCTLSNGEQTKVLLAVLFLKENRFLLIDEPTNHLDMAARRIVSDYLRSKKGFLLVSHDRDFLDRSIDHILSINKTNIEIQRGNFSSWLANKQRQDAFELAENHKLKKEIHKKKQAARQSKQWADKVESTKIGLGRAGDNRAYVGEQSRRMQQRRLNLERRQQEAITEKAALLKNIEKADSLKLSPLPYHAERLVSVHELTIAYGDKTVCQNVSFTVERGDRIALCGKNGAGKSSLLKLICGQSIPHTGTLQIGSGVMVSYVPQDTSNLAGTPDAFAAQHDLDESLFKAILRKLDFSRGQFEKDMRDYSGGQKKKVLIAKSLCQRAHLYVWDEPLNFIDVISRMQIESLLLEFCPTILFVEHDSAFYSGIATKQIRLGGT